MYRDQALLYGVIVTEYVSGISIGTAWSSLVKSPAVSGPFQTAEEVAKAIALRSNTLWSESIITAFYPTISLASSHSHSAIIRPCSPTEISTENVLARKVANSATKEEYEVAALVDWKRPVLSFLLGIRTCLPRIAGD